MTKLAPPPKKKSSSRYLWRERCHYRHRPPDMAEDGKR